MAKFELIFETYVQCQARVEVDAGSLSEAIEMAAALTLDPAAFEPDDEVSTEPRLYGVVGDSGLLARVRLPESGAEHSWTGVDLREQWARALVAPPTDEDARAFYDVGAAHCAALLPVIKDDGRAELEAEQLRRSTPPAPSSAPPIRK